MTAVTTKPRPAGRQLRGIAAAIVSLVALSACGSDGDGAPPGPDGSITSMLAAMPAITPDSGIRQVYFGNLVTATELVGIPRPAEVGSDAFFDWLLPVSGLPRDGKVAHVAALLPDAVNKNRMQEHAEFEEELGWSVLDVDAFIEYVAPPDRFTVIDGPVIKADLQGAAGAPVDDVYHVGDGEDFASDLTAVSAARPLGVPVRMGVRDGLLAVTPSTPHLRDWLDEEGPTLADDPAFVAMAERLDEASVYSAILQTAGSAGSTPFDAVALGLGLDARGPIALLVYHYPDAASATAAVPAHEQLLAGSSSRTNAPWSELFASSEVAASGSLVVATLRIQPDRPVTVLWSIMFSGDTLVPS